MQKQEIVDWLQLGSANDFNGFNLAGLSFKNLKLESLFSNALRLKREYRGDKVYFRGLIELSNICKKNCLYCGIRCDNKLVDRYQLEDDIVLKEAKFAYDAAYGSIVLQAGERSDSAFIEKVTRLVTQIKAMGLGITLSLGEQDREVYKEWFNAGAHRYLLRIESSDRELYEKIHPNDGLHSYSKRITALENLKQLGYFAGSGIMIGLPGQTVENLANDLLFLKKMEVSMVGMGPYIKHPSTPLAAIVDEQNDIDDKSKLLLSLKMVALLRHLLPHINIASTTALQVLDPLGREMGLLSGGNVIMPNLTESSVREKYQLYSGKPGLADDASSTKDVLLANLARFNIRVGWRELGDPIL